MPTKNARRFDALIDASSAILLYKADLIPICCKAYRLLITPSVYEEITVLEQPGAVIFSRLVNVKKVIFLLSDPPVPSCSLKDAMLDRLHKGERDTLLHYINGTGRFVIIDDGKGVRVCRNRDIPHVNALLFPFLLHFAGLMSKAACKAFFVRIKALGHYSASVVRWAENCTREDLLFFIEE